MGKNVYANGMAIAAKAGDGKLIAAFPDVCNSPPSPPAGPIPLPYPNTSFSKDLKDGAKSVKIGGKPAGLKSSHFASSPLGDEAATKTFGGSLITHTITGKAYFNAYSMDVKIEGENAPRHLDLMTNNHASYPGSTPPFTEMEDMALLALSDAKEDLCPCCWNPGGKCTAALPKTLPNGKPREPMSFREFYNLDEKDASGARSPKAAARQATLASKPCAGGSCPNAGKAEPKSEPPCDVYRVTTEDESETNSGGVSADQMRNLRAKNGVPQSKDALAQKVLGNSFAKAKDLAKTGVTNEQMNKAIQIDHTTPRAAGGCPTSEGNTTAHANKCANCKSVDNDLDTWNSQELTERRKALGI
jgi:hypothetical protein